MVYRPYLMQKGVCQKAVLGGTQICFEEIYDGPMPDKKVYIKTFLQAPRRTQAYLNIAKEHGKVWLEDREIQPTRVDERGFCYEITLDEKPAALVIERALASLLPMTVTLSTVYYRCMDAKDYLIHMKMLSPYGDMEGIGVSEAVSLDTDPSQISWTAPWAVPERIDFHALFAGEYASALTCANRDGVVMISSHCICRVGGNGHWREVKPGIIPLEKGQQLLICCKKSGNWGFAWEDKENILELPLVQTRDDLGKFLVLGRKTDDVNFTKPTEGQFWQFPIPGLTVRPYLDSSFFGQWFYALMVGNYGLLKSAEFLGRDDLVSYFEESMKILSEYDDYIRFEAKVYGEPTFHQRAVILDNLDSIGAMGLCLAEYYQRIGNPDTLKVLNRLLEAAKHNIPRFPDGTYHREDTMWADDIFMSLPFLMRVWEITGDKCCLEECFRQLRGFKQRLYMEDQNIFSHIFFLNEGQANRVPWGRGNGWIFLTMGDLLKKMSQYHVWEQYPAEYRELKESYLAFADGLIACQDEEGMLHQVLNDPASYRETSCTGMFAIGIAYGIQCGLLPRAHICYVQKAIGGLLKHSVTEDGVILGVCRGSSCSMDAKYYKQLGTVDDDDHGTGIVLLALTAFQELTKEET